MAALALGGATILIIGSLAAKGPGVPDEVARVANEYVRDHSDDPSAFTFRRTGTGGEVSFTVWYKGAQYACHVTTDGQGRAAAGAPFSCESAS